MEAQVKPAVLMPHYRPGLVPRLHHHPQPELLNLIMVFQAKCAVLMPHHPPLLVPSLLHPQPIPPLNPSTRDPARHAVLILPCNQLVMLPSLITGIRASLPRRFRLVLPNPKTGTAPRPNPLSLPRSVTYTFCYTCHSLLSQVQI